MKVLALDLSLTSTGYAVGGSTNPRAAVGTLDSGKRRGMDRLDWIRSQVIELVDGCDLVVIEDYAYSRANQAHQIGELGGVIRLTLTDLGYPWVPIGTGQLKSYATGKGNSGKNVMLVEAVKRLQYRGESNDEADALWLLEMAMDEYGIVQSEVPKAQRKALEKVEWPRLTKPDNGRQA